ncbi:MAG TPA: hypothetical protein VGV09_12105 [Steroidobacteraceae bacterium]|nr:hypothetical protein [Steroidobacteraceae bacterium]
MMTGAIEKRRDFLAYCDIHTKRPANLRAQAQVTQLMARPASLAVG